MAGVLCAWEYAARGPESFYYPWGDDVPWGRSCIDRALSTCAVGTHLGGMSPFGILDMVGNAREWTSSMHCVYNDPGCDSTNRVARGRIWLESDPVAMRLSGRWGYTPEGSSVGMGARCAL